MPEGPKTKKYTGTALSFLPAFLFSWIVITSGITTVKASAIKSIYLLINSFIRRIFDKAISFAGTS
jgi:hypothetical protein